MASSDQIESEEQELKDQKNIVTTIKVTKNNVLAFGSLYFIEGISYGHTVQFLPLVLAKQNVEVEKITFTRVVFLPWLLKPLFSKMVPNPTLKSLKICWVFLCLCTVLWLFAFKEGGIMSGFSVMKKVLICGVIIQLVTAIFDIIVDYIQVCTLKTKETLGWVKSLESGLYKVGSMCSGSALLFFTQDIPVSILVMLITYISIGFIALWCFKLPIFADDESDSSEVAMLKDSPVKEKSKNVSLISSLWDSKYFMMYLLTYKMFQGAFQSLIPLWLVNEMCYSLNQANIITGIVPSLTSLLGTGVGGSIPGMIQRQMQNDKESSKCKKLVKDIWFWLIFIMFLLAVMTNLIVSINHAFLNTDKNEFNCTAFHENATYHLTNQITSLQSKTETTKIVLCIMFIVIAFIGGLLTPLTFTEMTSKTQENVGIDDANVYLSFLSTFEVTGKFLWGLVCGSFVKGYGYQNTFLISSALQITCLLCYVFSRFERVR